jgi:phenylacetate-coenzyme A ligase PaaK-like adenylate-forming protein
VRSNVGSVPFRMAAEAAITTLVRRVLEGPSPFYLSRLGDAARGLQGTLDASTLQRLPLTRREELVGDQLAHLPHGTRRFGDAQAPVRAGIAGSGSDLLVLTWTAADLQRERQAGARVLARLGIEAGMRVANTLPGALATPGALLLGDVIEEIGGLDVPLGTVESEAAVRQAWELTDRIQPAVLILEPTSATRLFASAPAAARPWWRGVAWLRCDGEAWAPPEIPAVAGFSGWQRAWFAIPEATSFAAHACAAGRFHADEATLFEVVDTASGAVAPPAREGTLAVTALHADTALLRYASRARARALPSLCSCGESGTVVELI